MIETPAFRELLRRYVAPILGVAAVLLLHGAEATAEESVRSDCAQPTDDFSERIDSLLVTVEGSDADATLESWEARSDEIDAAFEEILELGASDVERRRAAVQTLLAARSLAASAEEARLLDSGPERGEVRAWARRALRDSSGIGVMAEDRKFVDKAFIGSLQEAWVDSELDHFDRSLPLYREQAEALRGLATFRESPSCR